MPLHDTLCVDDTAVEQCATVVRVCAVFGVTAEPEVETKLLRGKSVRLIGLQKSA